MSGFEVFSNEAQYEAPKTVSKTTQKKLAEWGLAHYN